MSVWGIIRNIGTVLGLLKAIRDVVSGVATTKSFPQAGEIKAVLDHIEALLDSGAIDIPGVDEKEISNALKQIEDFLMENAQKKAA